jgi:twitching motility protein PilT
MRTEETVRLGESEGKTFYEIIEASYTFGWRTFDQACIEAFEKGIITEESALAYCSKRGVVSRSIDNVKKQRGEITSNVSSLKMKPGAHSPAETAPTIKLK